MQAILIALVLALVLTVGYVANVERRLDRIRQALMVMEVGDVKTTWVSGGVTREVRTTQEPGETPAQHEERHFALVRAKRLEFPPDA